MKLYYTPGACSQAPHIVLQELDLKYEPVKVDLATHTLPDGSDFRAINPKGYVPMLELDDGTRLTEANVLLQYLADRKPGTLAPPTGTLERYKLMEWLAFIATEVHKGFGPLWNPQVEPAVRERTIAALGNRFGYIAQTLGKQPYLDRAVVHDRRCVPVRGPELDRLSQGRPQALAGTHRVPGEDRKATRRAGDAEGRRPGQVA